jgi:hypothetical protein
VRSPRKLRGNPDWQPLAESVLPRPLEQHFSRAEAQRQLDSAIEWGRYAKEQADSARRTHGLPMELRVGDRFVGESGEEWEVIGRPYTTACGKTTHPGERKVGQRRLTDVQTWSAQERVAVQPG